MAQVEEAFALFKQAAPAVELEVWFCDRGLCVFKVPPPAEMPAEFQTRLEALCWAWERNGDEFGDPCWYLFRSD